MLGKICTVSEKIFAAGDFYEDWLPYIAEIEKPQFLMVGEYDMTCGKYEQELFVRSAKNGKLMILKNCAHLTWFEYPKEYTEMIRQAVKWSGKQE